MPGELRPGYVPNDLLGRLVGFRLFSVQFVMTPDVLGSAARSGRQDLQALKRVWHYLARFGRRG